MSRIGNQPIKIPTGVVIESKKSGDVFVKGPKGELSRKIHNSVCVEIDKNAGIINVKNERKEKAFSKFHGLSRALIYNMVHGVSQGFEKILEIKGVGYRADVKGSDLNLNLGFSHPVVFNIPKEISIKVEKNTKLTVSGIDKEKVGQVAAVIRNYRKPEPYKGKGVKYLGEHIKHKEGKKTGKK